jgi:four helix bundle protein
VKGEKQQDIRERTFEFSVRMVRLCRELDKDTKISRTRSNQLLRSGTSTGPNVEEAQSSQSKADYTAKTYIACKEARETNYWLRLIGASEIFPAEKLELITKESNELVAILTTIVKKCYQQK